MTCANFPNDAGPLVLDTSVLINLHTSRSGEQIIQEAANRAATRISALKGE